MIEKIGIAAEDVAQQDDAVELEDVEGVAQLDERGVDVGQREHRQAGEAPGARRDQRCGRFVDEPCELVGEALIAERDAGW